MAVAGVEGDMVAEAVEAAEAVAALVVGAQALLDVADDG